MAAARVQNHLRGHREPLVRERVFNVQRPSITCNGLLQTVTGSYPILRMRMLCNHLIGLQINYCTVYLI